MLTTIILAALLMYASKLLLLLPKLWSAWKERMEEMILEDKAD